MDNNKFNSSLKDANYYSELSDKVIYKSKEERYKLVADIISDLLKKDEVLVSRVLKLNLSSSIISSYFNMVDSDDVFYLDEDFFNFVIKNLEGLKFNIPNSCKKDKKELVLYW